MIELALRTATLCFLMEIGSASNFTIAAMANSSPKWLLVLVSGIIGIFIADLVAVKLGGLLKTLPISSDLISGAIMVVVGSIFIVKSLA